MLIWVMLSWLLKNIRLLVVRCCGLIFGFCIVVRLCEVCGSCRFSIL